MRKFISIALVGVLSFGISYGAVHKVEKDQKKNENVFKLTIFQDDFNKKAA